MFDSDGSRTLPSAHAIAAPRAPTTHAPPSKKKPGAQRTRMPRGRSVQPLEEVNWAKGPQ